MAKPKPLINGKRVSPINVTISAANGDMTPCIKRIDITDGLISLDYVENLPLRHIRRQHLSHQGSMILSKETWEKFLDDIPYYCRNDTTCIYMSIVYRDRHVHKSFLQNVTMELINPEPIVEDLSSQGRTSSTVEITFALRCIYKKFAESQPLTRKE